VVGLYALCRGVQKDRTTVRDKRCVGPDFNAQSQSNIASKVVVRSDVLRTLYPRSDLTFVGGRSFRTTSLLRLRQAGPVQRALTWNDPDYTWPNES
jgi:hypothetical protein